ncbi:MAG: hypothetical protein ACOYT8_06245, partial [Candidatus Dependentiae bacterium]
SFHTLSDIISIGAFPFFCCSLAILANKSRRRSYLFNFRISSKKNGNDHLFKAICALAPTLKFGNTLITSSSNFSDCQGLLTLSTFLATAQITGYQLKNSILNYYRYLQINVDELEEELVTNKLALKWIKDDHNAKIDNKKKF